MEFNIDWNNMIDGFVIELLVASIFKLGPILIRKLIATLRNKRPKNKAERKVEVTMDLKRQYSRGELTKLLYRTREILKESREFTSPGVVTNNVEDLRDQRFIKSLREYLDELKEYSHHFEQDEKENITKNCKEIEEYISQLTEETDDKKRYSIEDKIHSSLGEILQVIKPKTELF